MIDADVRGKLREDGSNAHERSEDLLTSTVFGLLRYLPAKDSLIPLMSRVRSTQLHGSDLVIANFEQGEHAWMTLDNAVSCDIEFWPSFGPLGQPDVLLTFLDSTGLPVHHVVVEVKLHSPKSGATDSDNGVDAATATSEPGELLDSPDQLARYWRGLVSHCPGAGLGRGSVVYLTAHATPPVDELCASLRACPTMRLGWISWSDIWHITAPLTRQPNPPLAAVDITRLLAGRGMKALDPFKYSVPLLHGIGRFWQTGLWFDRITVPSVPDAAHFWEGN